MYQLKGTHSHIDLSQVSYFWPKIVSTDKCKFKLVVGLNGQEKVWGFDTEAEQEEALRDLAAAGGYSSYVHAPTTHATKGYGMKDLIGDLRGYLKDNRDLLFTIGLVVLLDHVLFDGAFRERLKSLVEGFLTRTENKLKVIDVTPKA